MANDPITSRRAGLPGPVGLLGQPSRGNPPSPPPLPEGVAPISPRSTAVTADLQAIVGFDLPPVETLVNAATEAAGIVSNLQGQIRTALTTKIAMADAIQGKISGQVLGSIRSAYETATASCANVHECIVANALGAIATVDQWMMTLPIGEEAHNAILTELSSIFGTGQAAVGTSPLVGEMAGGLQGGGGAGASSGMACGSVAAGWFDGFEATIGAGDQVDLPLPDGYYTSRSGTALIPVDPCAAFSDARLGNFTDDPSLAIGTVNIGPGASEVFPGLSQGINWIVAKLTTEPGSPGGYSSVYRALSPTEQAAAEAIVAAGCNCIPSGGGGGSPTPTPSPGPGPAPTPSSCPCVTCRCDPCTCPKPEDSCGSGTHWDSSIRKCVPDKPKPKPKQCKKGQYWDAQQEKCVDRPESAYCIYCHTDDQTTYLVSPGEDPQADDDTLIQCYDTLAEVPPHDEWPECPPPPPPDDQPPEVTLPPGSVWCSLSVCNAVSSFIASYNPGTSHTGGFVGLLQDPLETIDIEEITKDVNPFLRPIVSGGLQVIAWILQQAGGLVAQGTATSNCLNANYLTSLVTSIVTGFLERWLSSAFGEVDVANQYYRHLVCPQLTLTEEQATAAYLANAIDLPTMLCIVQANNKCAEPWQAYLESQRTKLGPGELASLRRRGIIQPSDFDDGMRALGYTRQADVDHVYDLTTQIPFVSDLLRMMVRDVADPALVQQFGMDSDFAQKWTGQLQDWGEQQGVETQYAQYVWRAHWSIPSPTQLYEMYHRLRSTPSPIPGQSWREVIETALKQQDILPFWIPHLLDVAFHPLNATDIVRAYSVGAIDEQGVTDGYTQLGYDDTNAQALTKFRRRERIEQARTLPITKLYDRDGVSFDDYEQYLLGRNYPQADVDEIVAQADQRKAAKTRETCVGSIKKRYMKGELDTATVLTELSGLGLDPTAAGNLSSRWQCEFSSRDPHVALKYLIGLYKRQIIGPAEFLRRCGNLGILPDLAGMIMKQADAEMGDAIAAKQAKQLRQQQQAALQAQRAAERLARQQAQAAKQAARAAAREAAAATAARKQLDAALKKLIAAGAPEADATTALTASMADLEGIWQAGVREAVAIVTLAAETVGTWSLADWGAAVDLAREEHLAALPVTGPGSA